jgi:hypothetical protein
MKLAPIKRLDERARTTPLTLSEDMYCEGSPCKDSSITIKKVRSFCGTTRSKVKNSIAHSDHEMRKLLCFVQSLRFELIRPEDEAPDQIHRGKGLESRVGDQKKKSNLRREVARGMEEANQERWGWIRTNPFSLVFLLPLFCLPYA